MAQLSPYLFFKDNCREAMMFYKDALVPHQESFVR